MIVFKIIALLKEALSLASQMFEWRDSQWLSLSDPQHPRAKGNIKWYEDLLAEEGVRKTELRKNLPAIVNRRPESVLGNKERTIYEALCRGEVPVVGLFSNL